MSLTDGNFRNPQQLDVEDREIPLKVRNRERARKLISEALAGTATASGTASPEQQVEAQGSTAGLAGPQGASPGAGSFDFNLLEKVKSRFPMQSTADISNASRGGDLDTFMHAISSQESGHDPTVTNKRSGAHGQFQIMPSNWDNWAEEAGLGRGAERTQENQNKVAAHKMQEYYDQFGSWDAVAVAWFAGPGRAKRYIEGDKSVLELSDGNMTVGEYINKMNQGMGAR